MDLYRNCIASCSKTLPEIGDKMKETAAERFCFEIFDAVW
jgi:hypothetical protein